MGPIDPITCIGSSMAFNTKRNEIKENGSPNTNLIYD